MEEENWEKVELVEEYKEQENVVPRLIISVYSLVQGDFNSFLVTV